MRGQGVKWSQDANYPQLFLREDELLWLFSATFYPQKSYQNPMYNVGISLFVLQRAPSYLFWLLTIL